MSNKTDAFFSGFMPTTAAENSTSQRLTYTIRVPDEKPIWFYCSQGKHCQAGMVGAINAYVYTSQAHVSRYAKLTYSQSCVWREDHAGIHRTRC